MTDSDNVAERTEQVVAQIMRGARDEKIRLDTVVEQQSARIVDFKQQIEELKVQHELLSDERDRYIKRMTALETDMRAIVSIVNDALTAAERGKVLGDVLPAVPRWNLTGGNGPAVE